MSADVLSVPEAFWKALGERIRDLREGDPPLSQREFADLLGVSQNTISAYERGEREPALSFLLALSRHSGQPLERLVFGDPEGLVPALVAQTAPPGFVAVPRLRIKASAGPGAYPDPDALRPEEEIFFREDWMRRMGINPKLAQAFTVQGRSMVPLLEEGDLVLVDRSVERLREDGIYVVVYGDAVKVKRVHVRVDGAVILRSEDPGIPDEILRGDELDLLRIEGQVRWFGRTI